jgi:DNA mismatch repair protein MutS
MSIARAVLEYCADPRRLGARTMFATHYHELTELENTLSGVKNLNTAVKKRGEDVIFLRRIVPGGADRSYGVEVAKLAGVPETVIRRAKAVLRELEQQARSAAPYPAEEETDALPEEAPEEQLSLRSRGMEEALDKLRDLDLNTLTPLEAMNCLFELKKQLQEEG